MEPFIKNNSIVLASGLSYLFKNPKVNDIVVFKDKEGKILIKRITKNEKDRYFVQGDNKGDSLDSSKFGDISKNQIIAKVICKL
ncbi:MAG: S26 family signal peptidase [Patescibacteria group bacterium]|nr:S26 family signal peptidase [Patescibacteria group bacterium]